MKTPFPAVLNVLSSALFCPGCADGEDWAADRLGQELLMQSVLPIAVAAAPDAFRAQWQRASHELVARNMAVSYEHAELHDLMTAHGIAYVVLKGVASASYYPQPILRTMGDVDFLVRPEDVQRAGALLEGIGFRAEAEGGGIHIGYQRGASTWELHRDVNGIPGGAAGALVREYLADIIETAVEYDEGNGVLRIPDDFHHGLVLLLHTASHLTSEGVGLRHLCDWAVFVNRFSGDAFPELFESRLRACGLWRFAQLLTLVCTRYLRVPAQSWAGTAEPEVPERMIRDILTGGNFGQKDEDRYRQIKYISNRGEHTVDKKGAVLQLLRTVSRKAELEHRSPLAVVLDYAGMVLRGERKPDGAATLREAEARKKLYAQFHLYEEEERS